MDDFYFPRKKKKSIDDLNVVPILDMFVSIVFFLLLSASMVGLTKIVMPPASINSINRQSAGVPINPKLWVAPSTTQSSMIKVLLQWEGSNPGRDLLELNQDSTLKTVAVVGEIQNMVKKFKEKFPAEKTVQIALHKDLSYQWLITIMDGVREALPDMVLSSYEVIPEDL